MSRRHPLLWLWAAVSAAALVVLAPSPSARAQGVANPFAPPEASEPLTSASPSGGLATGTYMDRARGAAATAGGAGANPFAQPGAAGAFAPPPPGEVPGVGTGYIGPAGYGYPAYPQAYGGQPAGPTPTPGPPPVKVLTGERVYSHLQFGASPPELLQDAEIVQVPGVVNELRKRYYDDGTHGDVKANDNVWSYVTARNDVMAPEEFRILNRILAALTSGEDTDPREFFRLPVATTEPLSKLPKMMNLEGERDGKLSEWNDRVLAEFRINKDDVTSQFWPVFIPPPPSAPRIEIPPGFNPAAQPEEQEGRGRFPGAAGFGGPAFVGAEGLPPDASSSYGMNIK